jgi:hypothetical protein
VPSSLTQIAFCIHPTSNPLQDFAHKSTGSNNALAERLFQAYFTDGIYPDIANLATLAAEVGLDADAARAHMADPKAIAAVQAEVRRNSKSTSGVPFFVMNGVPVWNRAPCVTFLLEFLLFFDLGKKDTVWLLWVDPLTIPPHTLHQSYHPTAPCWYQTFSGAQDTDAFISAFAQVAK